MHREMLIACLPWLGLIAIGVVALRLLARFSGARLRPARLKALQSDQVGSVQSLSFVLTLPLFIMVMMFIVQMSQLAIGTIVVHYAAYAAARSAIVWIPARVEGFDVDSLENCIGTKRIPEHAHYGPFLVGGDTDSTYKLRMIRKAAVLVCVPIGPSVLDGPNVGMGSQAESLVDDLFATYSAMAPESISNERIRPRLRNKVEYSLANTDVEIWLFHRQDQPEITYRQIGDPYRFPLDPAILDPPFVGDDMNEFYPNEVGWQDAITVTVTHYFALLPGPGRLLARPTRSTSTPDTVASQILPGAQGRYVFPIRASATLGNEGEKSVLPYAHTVYE